jgi:Tol biopolymer transport system component
MAEPTHDAPPSVRANEDRLDSWKEIATYLSRDVTTVQRWEKREGMPVHRHLHDSKGSVYASRAEVDAWVSSRNLRAVHQNGNDSTSDETAPQSRAPFSAPPRQDGHFGNAEEGSQAASAEKADPRLLPHTSQAANTPVDAGGVSTSLPLKLRWLLVVACLILTVVIAVWIRNRLLYDSPTHRITEQRITSNSPEAPVEWAVVSPDGKYLAYADPTGLYLRVIASGETRRWDVPKDFIAYPTSWFPDGTHLLVARFEGPTPSLWKLSLLGATPRKLVDNAGPASVSPDGTRIAFVTSPLSSGNQLWVEDADGFNPHKIAEASQPEGPGYPSSSILPPTWSPDSRRIACIEHHSGAALAPLAAVSSLWTRDADGGDLQVILRDTLLGSTLSWGPDGRILFASRANAAGERDDEEIHSIRVDERTGKATGEPQLVTNGAGTIGGISETLDGKRLVLWRNNTHEQTFISDFDAGTRKWKTPRRLTLDANGNMATDWLSDSRTVLFVSNRNGTWTLFKQAIDETTADVLVGGHGIYLPRLSADGSQVLYLSQTDPADPSVPISLMRLPVTGGPPELVLRDIGLGNYQCARLPSTLCIGTKFEKDEVIFFAFDPGRGIGRELLKIRGLVHDWSLAPDGRTLADLPHGHSIRFFSVENGVAREDKTVTLNEWPIENGDWNADGSGLLIPSITPTGTPVILEVNRAGKASVVLEGAANTPFEFMIQAPDGHHGILGAIVPGDNNAWMIDNF